MLNRIKNLVKSFGTEDFLLLGFLSSLLLFLFVLTIGYIISYQEHKQNGLKKGVLVSYHFKPKTEETTVTNTIDINGQPQVHISEETEEAFITAIVTNNGREEVWKTYHVSKELTLGDSLSINEGWEWIGTNKIK